MPTSSLRTSLVAALLLSAPALSSHLGPELVSPGSREAFEPVSSACPTFSWSAAPEATGYELHVYEVPHHEAEIGASQKSLSETEPVLIRSIPGGAVSWTPATTECFQMFGRYAWTVRALREGSSELWSESRLFRIAPDPLVERIARVLEDAIGRYLETPDAGTLANLISDELHRNASPPEASQPPTEKTLFFMGEEQPVSKVEAYFAQRRAQGPEPAAPIAGTLVHSGALGGTSSLVFTDEPEVVIDDEFDTAATGGILIFRSENTFDWGWKSNSAEANGSLVLVGGDGFGGDAVSFPPTGGARFNDAFVLNEFQLDPKTSGSRPICNSISDEGLLYYDTADGLCYCNGSSWRQVDGDAAC